jgi:hypothetical protein
MPLSRAGRGFQVQPPVEWFNAAVTKDSGTTVAGTFDYGAGEAYGRIGIPQNCALAAIHVHGFRDGSGGQFDVEVYRLRSSVFTRIATGTLSAGGGDGGFTNMTITDGDAQAGDYLLMQLAAKQTGNGTAFVDVHFDPVTI